MSEEKNKIKLNIPTIIISIVGFFVSLYALVLHIKNIMQPGHGALCDINAAFNCSTVIGSSYGEFAAIPLGSYGMTYFILLFAGAILPKISVITKRQHATLEFILGLVGFISVVSLFYISHSILKTICPVCTIIHVLVTIYFILKTLSFARNKELSQVNPHGSDYFIRFIAVCICLGLPPLAAGLIAPIVIDKYFSSSVQKEVKSIFQTKTPPEILLDENSKEKLLTINKTNYVGNGEDYRRGNDDAKVVVQMFSDFGCPHCKQANTALLQAQERVGLNKVLVVYRFFPLSNKCNPFVPNEGWYPYSCILTQAARCAGSQGKFWEFKEWGFAGQDWSDEQRAQSFSLTGIQEEAKNLGLNVAEFSQCIEKGGELNKIKDDAALGDTMKIKGTPFILINGHEYVGGHTVDEFSEAFEKNN